MRLGGGGFFLHSPLTASVPTLAADQSALF